MTPMVSEKLQRKLQGLPNKPGVYLMRDKRGRIIYVGKAASLRDRVRSYFRQATLRSADAKLRGLLHSIEDLDVLVVRTEAEATLTEGRLIKEYRPRYNSLFKDDKRFLMIRADLQHPFPRFVAVRLQKDDGATYFGPYASSSSARAALDFVEKRFGLRRCMSATPGPEDHKHCLNDILRYCMTPCIGKISEADYRTRAEEAAAFLRGERPEYLLELQQTMTKEAQAQHFERAAALRDTLVRLRQAIKQRALAARSFAMKVEDARAGLEELRTALNLAEPPRLIEAYDISNIGGTLAVGSLVCAVDGLPQRNRYRLFRIRTVEGSDDPAMLAEVIRRRFERLQRERGERPGLVLVDGGVAQLHAARAELDRLSLSAVPVAGLAKQFEELYDAGHGVDNPLRLPPDGAALKVLQRLRDEAHRFALTYHRRLRLKLIRESALDDIPGIGEKRKEALIAHFGSVARLRQASEADIAALPGIGPELARQIAEGLGPVRKATPIKTL
jgi:excinuclease ABC subunit C